MSGISGISEFPLWTLDILFFYNLQFLVFYGPSTFFSDPRQFTLDPRHFTLDPRPSTQTQTPNKGIQ